MTHPSQVCMTGPLVPWQDGLWADLLRRGYAQFSARNVVGVASHLSRWLTAVRVAPSALTEDRIEAFLQARRAAGYTCWLSRRGLEPILRFLRSVGAIPLPGPRPQDLTPIGRLLIAYRSYLVEERGITEGVAGGYVGVAKELVDELEISDPGELSALTTAQISGAIVHKARSDRPKTARSSVSPLRSFLRYLHLRGLCRDLSAAVPAVAGYRLSGLPKELPEGDVRRMLDHCDRETKPGLRDFAMLLLLSRLGLRSVEVARLELDDVAWAKGELTVRGKGAEGRLPLPLDVGRAMVAYLKKARPASTSRRFFLLTRVPFGPITSQTLQAAVRSASLRAGLPPVGAHRLRHTVATRMLRNGASLPEIAHVLRHRSLLTTAIYAKVDRRALRDLARPWPGGDE